MIVTFENFAYNEGVTLNKEILEKALKTVQDKMPLEKFVSYIKKHKKKVKWLLNHFTNGKDTIYANKLLVNNEGFRDTFIYDIFVEPFTEGGDKIMGGVMWFIALLVAFMLYLLGVYIYLNVFYTPMDRGIVQKSEYVAGATVLVPMTTVCGKSTITTLVPMYIPPHYNVKVKELHTSETEEWTTDNIVKGERLQKGDTISWDDALYDVTQGK